MDALQKLDEMIMLLKSMDTAEEAKSAVILLAGIVNLDVKDPKKDNEQ